jgi:hypothetical protein
VSSNVLSLDRGGLLSEMRHLLRYYQVPVVVFNEMKELTATGARKDRLFAGERTAKEDQTSPPYDEPSLLHPWSRLPTCTYTLTHPLPPLLLLLQLLSALVLRLLSLILLALVLDDSHFNMTTTTDRYLEGPLAVLSFKQCAG